MSSGVQCLDCIAAGVAAQVAGQQVAHAQDLGAALAHELAAFAQQVTHGALLARIDVAGGQNAQAQQVGQVARIAEVAAVLQTALLLDSGSVDQVQSKTRVLQAIDQPVPVVGGLHRHAVQLARA